MKKLKTIFEHDDQRYAQIQEWKNSTTGNGIACPKCGAELFDQPGISLTSDPPRTPVFCKVPTCGFRSSRVS